MNFFERTFGHRDRVSRGWREGGCRGSAVITGTLLSTKRWGNPGSPCARHRAAVEQCLRAIHEIT
jgi:hypothetical protein